MIKTRTWSVGDGKWIVHIRKTLNQRFINEFKDVELVSTYMIKGKEVAYDYKFDRDKCLNAIKKWLRTEDKS